jgi:hypothetical protein
MRIHASRIAFVGLAGAALLYAGMAQAAMDPKKVADSLVAAVGASGQSKASYAKSAASGADVVISSFKITNPGGDTLEIPTITVSAPADRTPGGFTAARIAFDKGKVTNKDSTVVWNTGLVENATVPSADEIKAKTRVTPFSKLSIGGFSVSGSELKAPVAISSLTVALADVKDGVPHDMKLNVDGVALPPALFADPKAKATLDQLGYTNGFVGAMAVDGTYVSASDTLTLKTLSFSADNVGKLTFGSTVSGLPLSKLANSEKASELMATAMVNAATIRFDNAGVVERLLDMQAKATGVDRKTFVASTSAAMPFLLTQVFSSPDFRNKFAAAASAFLNEPKSFILTAAPASPVPVMQIIGAATSKPDSLADVLTLDVQANK